LSFKFSKLIFFSRFSFYCRLPFYHIRGENETVYCPAGAARAAGAGGGRQPERQGQPGRPAAQVAAGQTCFLTNQGKWLPKKRKPACFQSHAGIYAGFL